MTNHWWYRQKDGDIWCHGYKTVLVYWMMHASSRFQRECEIHSQISLPGAPKEVFTLRCCKTLLTNVPIAGCCVEQLIDLQPGALPFINWVLWSMDVLSSLRDRGNLEELLATNFWRYGNKMALCWQVGDKFGFKMFTFGVRRTVNTASISWPKSEMPKERFSLGCDNFRDQLVIPNPLYLWIWEIFNSI